MDSSRTRNFCIIAHIDHGKSTLADRFLEVTGTVDRRAMREQLLDTMDLERERGITIKLQPVRLDYQGYSLNLIDTPGHVDFSYEVSRSLAAVEGALLLIDASQGVQAQTVANLHLATEQGVVVVPVLNKLDLPNADVPRVEREIAQLLGRDSRGILKVSAKLGTGVSELLQAIIDRVPGPAGDLRRPLQALVFDSQFDEYRGVIAYVRIVNGTLRAGEAVRFSATGATSEAQEVGVFKPHFVARAELTAGDIGYLVTGLKEVRECRVGDTIIHSAGASANALPGYREVRPMVFAGLFPAIGDQYALLRKALERLALNDAALVFEPEHAPALGFGFRAGFLGLLHLDVTQERLRREFSLELTVTVPSVAYRVTLRNGVTVTVKSPLELPATTTVVQVAEPWVRLDIMAPARYVGPVMQLSSERRGQYLTTDYLDERVILRYRLPLSSLLVDFYDKLKGMTAGYASMNYDFDGYEPADVVRLDVLVAEEPVEALATIVYRDQAYERGRSIAAALKTAIPRQQFEVKIQAAVAGKIIAAERLAPLRKDVTAKLYGGDVTRKQKLLKKQRAGKRRLAATGRGRVPIPSAAYLKVLKGSL